MMARISISTILLLLASLALADTPYPIMGTESYLPPGPVASSMKPDNWGLDYVGQPEEIGTTWYDYQHNSSMSRMLAYGPDGSVHCCWMNGLNSGASQRVIYYNKKLPSGTWLYGSTGIQVNSTTRCGYCTMDLDMSGNAVIAYHGYDVGPLNHIYVWNSTGEHACPPTPAGYDELAWPHVCVDVRDYIHVITKTNSAANNVHVLFYTRSEDGGFTWTDWQAVVDMGTAGAVSQTICSDLVTGKVAIGYCKPISGSVFQEDVFLVESPDGVTWDFANPVNITNFTAGVHPMSSSTRAYADVNLLYDHNGILHAVYTSISYPTLTYGGMIWHFSQPTGHRKVTGTFSATPWIALNNPGAWRRSIDRPHISEDANGVLYCQWGQCTTPGDVSSGGYGNWDVYVTYSTDGGMNWMAPVNITDTATPGAPPGECLSENWANLAKVATDKLHIQYIKDLDAGGIPQNEGTWTLNPVVYQGVPVDSILTDLQVTLTPDTLPIIIPPEGGIFGFSVQVANLGEYTVHFDGWIDVTLPNGSTYQILMRPEITMPAGGSIERALTQYVPGNAPAGDYIFMAHAGDFGWNVWGEDSFSFTKTGVNTSAADGWKCTGWDESPEIAVIKPTNHLLASANPNPFNPTTTISFSLPQADRVTLTVYDIRGRTVAVLVDGFRDAGLQEVTWDASNIASGVYLYRIQAGDFSAVRKLMLMK